MKDPKIYSDCYQAVIQIFHRTKSIPKHLRPTLGRRIEDSALGCHWDIVTLQNARKLF